MRGDAISEEVSEEVRRESSRELAERLSRMSVEELADYFDGHSTADMPLEPAEDVEVERDKLEQVSLRIPAGDLAELRRQASEKGIGYTTLIGGGLRSLSRAAIVTYVVWVASESGRRLLMSSSNRP